MKLKNNKKSIALSLVLFFIFSIFSPLSSFFYWEKKYEYIENTSQITSEIKPVFALESSNYLLPKKVSYYQKSGVYKNTNNFDLIAFKIPKQNTNINDLSGFIYVDSKKIPIQIEDEVNEKDLLNDYYFSEPIFTNSINQISYEINSKIKNNLIGNIELVTINSANYSENLAWKIDSIDASNEETVSRKDWGADETLKYADNPKWVAILTKEEENSKKPKTSRQLAQEEKIKNIRQYLAQNFSLEDTPINVKREENGHQLVWPVEQTKRVEKIVIHHTADSVASDTRDDASIMRAMYYYHTITKGWGDIGYNYVVGRDGKIYEGRAGGNYNVAAHALRNNKSTVGISAMGNFENETVSSAQKNGIDRAIGLLAKKYGIDINKTSIGHKECKDSEGCLLKDYSTPNLVGHKDVGYTACPGANLYPLLTEFRDYAKYYSSGLNYIENTNIVPDTITSLPKGPKIKIKLSFTGETIDIKSYTPENMKIAIGNRSGTTKLKSLHFETRGTGSIALIIGKKSLKIPSIEISSTVLEISNWSRKPSWDKSGVLNDNKFRGKLKIYNDNGILTVINELPLEDYLKGLAEISNNENSEKAKVILVAARSYALWYTDPNNRKFPGKPYDGSDDPDVFQKYLGYSYETRSANISDYLDETNGEVIKFDSKLIKPWYFNQSNGKTRSYLEYCKLNTPNANCADIPYLQSVIDPAGTGDGSYKGHGVGISGNGAKTLADQGKTYKEIIEYFLKGVSVEKISY